MTKRDEKQADLKRKYNKNAYAKRKKAVTQDNERRTLFSARIRDSIMARTRRLVDEYIATGRFGYHTMTEAFEDLVLRGMGTLRGDPTVDEMMPYMEWMQTIDRLHRARREAQGGLNRAKEEINELQAIGAHDGAARVYHLALDAAHAMPPTEWRDWMIKELAKSFPELAKRVLRGVDLNAERRIVKDSKHEDRRVVSIKERRRRAARAS